MILKQKKLEKNGEINSLKLWQIAIQKGIDKKGPKPPVWKTNKMFPSQIVGSPEFRQLSRIRGNSV